MNGRCVWLFCVVLHITMHARKNEDIDGEYEIYEIGTFGTYHQTILLVLATDNTKQSVLH